MAIRQNYKLRSYLKKHLPWTIILEDLDIAIVDFKDGILTYSEEVIKSEVVCMANGDPAGAYAYIRFSIQPVAADGFIKIIKTHNKGGN